jgi:hypothetical protein
MITVLSALSIILRIVSERNYTVVHVQRELRELAL